LGFKTISGKQLLKAGGPSLHGIIKSKYREFKEKYNNI